MQTGRGEAGTWVPAPWRGTMMQQAGERADACDKMEGRRKQCTGRKGGAAIPHDSRPKDSRRGKLPGQLPGNGRLIRRGTR